MVHLATNQKLPYRQKVTLATNESRHVLRRGVVDGDLAHGEESNERERQR
jgi:hypothetical protein